MTQYINKNDLEEYIKNRYLEHQTGNQAIGCLDRMDEDKEILSYLQHLKVKEVDLEDEDMVDREIARENSILDETRVEYFATGNPTIAAYSEDNLRNQFDAGADWMKEQLIRALKGEK